MDWAFVPCYLWHSVLKTPCKAFSAKCWLVTSCMTYLEGLSLLSCNAKRCRNALHENSMMPNSYLAYKLFQCCLEERPRAGSVSFITHACCHDKEISKIQEGGGTNLTKDQGSQAFQSRLLPSEWLQGALLQSCSSPHHSKRHFCRVPFLKAKGGGT